MHARSASFTGISTAHIMGTELQPAALAAAAGNAASRSGVTVKNANTMLSSSRRFRPTMASRSLAVAWKIPSLLFVTGATAPRMAKISAPNAPSLLRISSF